MRIRTLVGVVAAGALAGCLPVRSSQSQGDQRALFDGKTTAGWRGYKTNVVPPGWLVVDGTLAKTTPVADVVTVDQFGDFELEIEWKIGCGGNNGIFYRFTEEYDRIYWAAPEYQVLDDINGADGKSRMTSAGAVHGVCPSPDYGRTKAARIAPQGDHDGDPAFRNIRIRELK